MDQLLIALAAILVAVTPLVRAWVMAKLSPQRIATVHQLAQVAVNAAEKVGEASADITNDSKYAVAEGFLLDAAKRVGLKLTANEVNGFIQNALRDFENAGVIVKNITAP